MRVLVAAAGAPGTAATETLEAAGFSVEHVNTLADARVRTATVPVAVVGSLRDATPADLRVALRTADVDTPLVGIDGDGNYAATVDHPDDERLPTAVRLAPHAANYRDAVDDLFDQCRRRASGRDIADTGAAVGDTADERAAAAAVTAAHRTATDRLDRVRRLAGRTPYEVLFED